MNDEFESEPSPHEEIARLEQRLEELAEDIERCRKLSILAKVMVAGGVAWLIAGIAGLVGSGAIALMVSIASTLSGLILGGSNRSTMEHLQADIGRTEERRNNLIGVIDLRTVRTRTAAPDTPVRGLH
jgi:hypothetical protein